MENFKIFTQDSNKSLEASINDKHNQSVGNLNHQHQDILTIFKISGSSLQVWKSKYQDKNISYKLCIIDFKRKDSELDLKTDDYSSNISEYVNNISKVEIAVLNENECIFKNQDQFGRIFNSEEYVFIKATIDDINKWAFMVDFYVTGNPSSTDSSDHIGYSYILPLNLQDSNGTINSVITGTNHKPIGHFIADYLIVKPLKGYSKTLVGFNNWSDFNPGLEVGHRGAGKWRRTDKIENVLENTIASFNYAANHGADMVELDVHLSKDKVPVIYHDFLISISIKKKNTSSDSSVVSDTVRVEHAVNNLTLNELQMLKLSPVNNLNHDFSDTDPLENQPFPTLKQVLESVPNTCGFNIEIKYPMKKCDDKLEGPYDKDVSENEFVDIILTTLMEHGDQRRMVLSTFHPDICILLRLKQNKYPVLFLTQGKTKRYTCFKDPRAAKTENAIYLAKIFNFWGVNVHAEDLFNNLKLIKYIKNLGLKLFAWGEDINSNNAVHQLKSEGVDGIIYDKIDVYNTKFVAVDSELKEIQAENLNNNDIQFSSQQQSTVA